MLDFGGRVYNYLSVVALVLARDTDILVASIAYLGNVFRMYWMIHFLDVICHIKQIKKVRTSS